MTDNLNSENQKNAKNIFLRWIRLLLTLTILFFLFRAIYKNYSAVAEYSSEINYIYLLLSILTLLTYLFLQALVWKSILKRFEINTGHFETFWAFFTSIFGKYVPGKIWAIAIRTVSLSNKGEDSGDVFTSIIFEHIYIILSGSFYYLLFWSDAQILSPSISIWLYPTIIVLIILLILKPDLIIYPSNLILKRTGRDPIQIRISVIDSSKYFLFYLFTWLVLSCGVWLLVAALVSVPFSMIFKLGSAFSLSFVGGFLVLLSPAGLGIREGIFVLLTAGIFPIYISAVIAFLIRFAFTAAELLGILFLFIIRKLYVKNRII